jgi:predicted outer membrane repeat protein
MCVAVFYHSDTDLTIRRSTFANNAGTSPGGHVRAPLDFSGGIVIIDSCNFTYNYASLGGAVFVYDTDLRITNSSFENNMGLVAGGAIFANGNSTVTLTYSKFRGNRALTGGVVYANVASVKVSFSEFTLNLASDAGVIFAQNSTIEVGNTDFLGNTADPGVGGAIASTGSSILTIANDTYFVANTANYGGAIFIEKSATISMLRILFSLCSAKQGGGAIYASTNVLVDLNRVYMFDSSALNLHGGGVLAVRGSRVRIQSSVFEGSVAREGGAGLFRKINELLFLS